MKITFDKELLDNKYSAEVKTEFTDQELELITKFGDSQINVGGTITGPPAFDLEDQYRAIKAGFPYTYSIDGNGDSQAKDKMNAWITEVRDRLISAINTLRGKTDDYSGEVVETV